MYEDKELLEIHEAILHPENVAVNGSDTWTVAHVKAFILKSRTPLSLTPSATVGEEEIKRFRVGDILFSDEQATIFCDLALKGVRAEIVHKHDDALRATEAGDWLPLLEMFSESEVLLHGAAGEDAMNVGDVVKIVRELALAQVELRAARELYAMASIAPSAIPSASCPKCGADCIVTRGSDPFTFHYKATASPSVSPDLLDVLREYDGITSNADLGDHEWDFVMRATDYRLIRECLAKLPIEIVNPPKGWTP